MTRDLDNLENFNYLWDDVWIMIQQEEKEEDEISSE
jgi:hypothetical protein